MLTKYIGGLQMILNKKWLVILTTITFALLLAACGGSDADSNTSVAANNESEKSPAPVDYLPISEGFEEYPVWILTEDTPDRGSDIRQILVFKSGEVTTYKFNVDSKYANELAIEDILNLSDDELIKVAAETSNKKYDEHQAEVINNKLFDLQSFNEEMDNIYYVLEDYYGKDLRSEYDDYLEKQRIMTEDMYISIEGDRTIEPSKYNLDIRIDDMGQYTEKIELDILDADINLIRNGTAAQLNKLIDFMYFNIDFIFWESPEEIERIKNDYIRELEDFGHFVDKEGFAPNHPQNFVANPFVWEKSDIKLTIEPGQVHQKIFDTTFSGLRIGNLSLLTRVDDSFMGFTLDEPDTDKENVTIEGK